MVKFDIIFKVHNEIEASDEKEVVIKMGELIMDIQSWGDFMIIKKVKD